MLDYLYTSVAVANAEIRKLMRDPTELFSRAVQPVLWLAVFGQVRGIPTGRRASLRRAFCSARSLRARHHLEA